MPDRILAPAAMATLLCLMVTAVPAQTSAQTFAQTSAQTPAQVTAQTPGTMSAQTPGTMSAERGWSSIARCAQEDSERARHTCLDRVLRDAGLLTNEMRARQQRNAFGLEDKPARAPPTAAPAATASATTPPVATPPAATAPATIPPVATPRGATPSVATAPSAAPPAAVSTVRTPAAASVPAPASAAQPDRLEVELAAVQKAADGKLFVTTTDGAVWLQNETVDMPQLPVAGDRMTIRKGSMGGYRCSVVSTHLTYRCVRSR